MKKVIKPIIYVCAILVVSLIRTFLCSWEVAIYDAGVEGSGYGNFGQLSGNSYIEQSFSCEMNGLEGVQVQPVTFEQTDNGSMTFTYTGLSASARYYYGTSYTFNPSTRSYTLSGDLHSGTLSSDEVGYYTCFSTSSTASCQRLFYTTRYASSTSMVVSARAYGTTSVANSVENVNNSTMKTYLDNWYQNNLSDVDDKISKDATFCNNRTKSTYNSGTYNNAGYGINPTIYGYERMYKWTSQGKLGPTLACETNDTFSVNRGNGELTYPIGLITADEANMAGGITGSVNSLYYLYSGTTYWTMSPSNFHYGFYAVELDVTSTGAVHYNRTSAGYGVRPVINLDTSKITFTGSGTMQDPYVIA